MAQILITNYTGYVPSDVIMYQPIGTCPSCSPDINNPINISQDYNNGEQATPGMGPTWFTIPSTFDNQQYAWVQLSASTFLQSLPQLIDCTAEGPITTFKFEKCGVGTDKNIYVFYDASGYFPDGLNTGSGDMTLSAASTNIRSWYNDLYTNSGYTGFLFEIPLVNRRFINWPCYPYLGSTTGGTLSDSSTVRIEAGTVAVQGMSGGIDNYQNQVFQSIIIRRIALALDLGTGSALPTTGGFSSGVPFPHGNYTTVGAVLGEFAGGDTNYVSIIVGGNNGGVGLGQNGCFDDWATSGGTFFYQPYFGIESATTINNPSDEVVPPVVRIPTPCGEWTNYTDPTYSGSSLQRDYESYLKVYNDVVNNLNGFMKVLFMPFPSEQLPLDIDPWFMYGQLYQMIELREGEVPSIAGYLEYYAEDPYGYDGGQWSTFNVYLNQLAYNNFNQYSVSYDFIPLAYFNNYTGLTATTTYQSLPATSQNGPGLKHFGWEVDPTLTGFSTTVFQRNFEANVTSSEFIYLSAGTFTEGYVYVFENTSGVDFEGCWQYVGTRLDGQPISILDTVAEFEDCSECYGLPAPLIYAYKYDGLQAATIISPQPPFYASDSNNTNLELYTVGGVDFDMELVAPYFPLLVSPPYGGGAPIYKVITSLPVVNQLSIPTPYDTFTSTGFTVTSFGSITNYSEIQFNFSIAAANANVNMYTYFTLEVTAVTPSTIAYNSPYAHQIQIAYTGGTTDDTDGRFHFIYINNTQTRAMVCLGESPTNYSSNANSGTALSNWAIERAYVVTSDSSGLIQTNSLSNILGDSTFRLTSITDGTPITTAGWLALSNAYYTIDGYETFTEKIAVQVNGSGTIIAVSPIQY